MQTLVAQCQHAARSIELPEAGIGSARVVDPIPQLVAALEFRFGDDESLTRRASSSLVVVAAAVDVMIGRS